MQLRRFLCLAKKKTDRAPEHAIPIHQYPPHDSADEAAGYLAKWPDGDQHVMDELTVGQVRRKLSQSANAVRKHVAIWSGTEAITHHTM